MTVPMALVQGYGQLIIVQSVAPGAIPQPELTGPNALPTLSAIITMTAGTMFLVWIGELISEKGIGNGISIIIFAGIIAGLPQFIGGRLYTGTGEGYHGHVLPVDHDGWACRVHRLLPGGAAAHSCSVLAQRLPFRPHVQTVRPDAHTTEASTAPV